QILAGRPPPAQPAVAGRVPTGAHRSGGHRGSVRGGTPAARRPRPPAGAVVPRGPPRVPPPLAAGRVRVGGGRWRHPGRPDDRRPPGPAGRRSAPGGPARRTAAIRPGDGHAVPGARVLPRATARGGADRDAGGTAVPRP